ncbi:hypothetical protein GGI08_007493, partial [Coemansia sp. S2]
MEDDASSSAQATRPPGASPSVAAGKWRRSVAAVGTFDGSSEDDGSSRPRLNRSRS